MKPEAEAARRTQAATSEDIEIIEYGMTQREFVLCVVAIMLAIVGIMTA